jgi:hypothetical protein
MSVGVLTAQTKCDFSEVTFEKFNQRGNEMYFRTNLDEDACLYYYFTAYDYQLKRLDTLQAFGSITGVVFNSKGKYQMRLNVVNECEKCDTVFTYEVDITIFGKVGVEAKPGLKNCKEYSVSMKDFKDTCMEYYYSVWKAEPWMNKLTDTEYEKLSDSALYFGYSFDEKYLIDYNVKSERSFYVTFKDSGRHFVVATWYNKCTGIDTFMYKKLDVCKRVNTTNVKQLVKQDNITVVGYYDLIGRKVDYIEPNKVYIVLYSNGKYAKVVQEL